MKLKTEDYNITTPELANVIALLEDITVVDPNELEVFFFSFFFFSFSFLFLFFFFSFSFLFSFFFLFGDQLFIYFFQDILYERSLAICSSQ